MKTIIVSALGLVALVGCSAATDGGGGDTEAAQAPQVFQETVIRTASDGSPLVYTRPITLEEELADNAARAAEQVDGTTAERGAHPETAVDSACTLRDIWLYDATKETGNKVCISGTGFQDLSVVNFYCLPTRMGTICKKASGNVRSFWPGALRSGASAGYFESAGITPYCDQQFRPDGVGADSTCLTANYLALAPVIQ